MPLNRSPEADDPKLQMLVDLASTDPIRFALKTEIERLRDAIAKERAFVRAHNKHIEHLKKSLDTALLFANAWEVLDSKTKEHDE